MFNWFRRHEKELKPEVPQTSVETTPTESETPATTSESEDYLVWAKAAYQNIQQRKETATSQEESASDETELEITETSEPEANLNVPAWMRQERGQKNSKPLRSKLLKKPRLPVS